MDDLPLDPDEAEGAGADARGDGLLAPLAPPREPPPLFARPSLKILSVVTARGTLGGATVGLGGAGAAGRAFGTDGLRTSRPFARSDVGGTFAVASFAEPFCPG